MPNSERFTIECEGVFDLSSALGVEQTMALVRPGARVELDLSRIREFHDAGLAVLARAIQRAGATHRLDVRGLRDRQLRLLRYLGVELEGPRHRHDRHEHHDHRS